MKHKNSCNCIDFYRIFFIRASLMAVICLLVQAATMKAYSQTTNVTLSFKNATVKQVLNDIEAKTTYHFLFNDQDVDVNRKVSLTDTKQDINDVLSQLFKGTDIVFRIEGKQIVLTKHKPIARPIKGTVKDEKGEPVIGASVVIQGTTQGTITDVNGNFSLTAPANATLNVAYIGYETVKMPVEGKTQLVINLQQSAVALNEVVAIGYGQVKKSDATGSLSTVSSKDFNMGAISSPEQLLEGKSAGVVVTSNSGAPGISSTIRIEGGSSLYASNDPLYVIDGVPILSTTAAGSSGPLSTLNPSDIESFTILKDASATAIYGSRASGGVILITTKKGGKKLSITYNESTSIATVPKTLNVLNATDFRAAVAEHYPGSVDLLGTGTDQTSSTNWQNEIFQTALGQDHTLSISGTTGKLPYRVSVGYNNTDGILKTYNFNRTTMDVGLDPNFLNNSLKVHVNLNGTYNGNNFADQSAIANAVSMDPTKPVFNNNTAWRGYTTWTQNANSNPNGAAVALGTPNPVAQLNLTDNTSTVLRSIGSVSFDYHVPFIPELHANLNMGYDYSESKGHNNVQDSTAWTNNATVAGGYYNPYHQINQNTSFDFYLNYIKQINPIRSEFNLMAGYSYAHSYSSITDSTMNAAKTAYSAVATFSPTAVNLVSFYGRLNYTLMDKYLLTFTLRDDGTSRFGPGNKWGLFPAAAFAWKINDESFLKNSRVISELKLRLGYGVTGQQQINQGDFPYVGSYQFGDSFTQYGLGNQFITTVRPNGYDANIKWETTKNANVGLDYGFLNNRISGSIDVFNKITDNLISQVPPAAGTNFTNSLLSNVGSLNNKGLDFAINGTIISTHDWNWEVGYNISFDKVKITKLTSSNIPNYSIPQGFIQGSSNDNAQVFMVGQTPYAFYVYQQVYDKNGMPVEGVYVDRNHDGIINSSDLYCDHSPTPDAVMGISSRLKYKNWDFAFDGRVSLGNYVFNNVAANSTWNTVLHNADYLQNVTTQIYQTNFQYQEYHSDIYIQNASFFRMDDMSLGYNFGNLFNQKVNLRLSLTCQNVFVITPYKGLDPEINGGIDNNFFPRPRTYVAGLNLQF